MSRVRAQHASRNTSALPLPPPPDDPEPGIVIREYRDGSVDVYDPDDESVWHVERALRSPPVPAASRESPCRGRCPAALA